MRSCLYVGRVGHQRPEPLRHAFQYRVFSLLLDLDELDVIAAQCRLLHIDAPGLIGFRQADHGPGTPSGLKGWAQSVFHEHGLGAERIALLCFPRLLGHVFNPLALYYGQDAAGRPTGAIYQVTNTFGDRHCYVLGPDTHACAKRFHVSPFFPMDGSYRFRAPLPGDTLDLAITYLDTAGRTRLVARQTGVRRPLTDAALLRALARNPLMAVKVLGGIHWEALRLWRKGARYHRRPAGAPRQFTIDLPETACV